MPLSARTKKLVSEITDAKLGDIKKRAKEIKKDHDLALELWEAGAFEPRMLSVLILDKKQLDQALLDRFAADLLEIEEKELTQIADWLMANQLMKDKRLVALLESWEEHPSPVLRRLFWYYQARLRWSGKAPPGNSASLMKSMESKMADEEPIVQWTMNFCAAWMGVYETKYRARCVKLGKKLGLYKDFKVPKNCVPMYLPDFIRIETEKREASL